MLLFCAFSLAVSWIYLPREVSCSTREYFIAAVERNWDYAPSGQNMIKGIPLITGTVKSSYGVMRVNARNR